MIDRFGCCTGCDDCLGYYDPPAYPPGKFTRRRMVRARKRHNAAVRREPNPSGSPAHWGTLDPEDQQWAAFYATRRRA